MEWRALSLRAFLNGAYAAGVGRYGAGPFDEWLDPPPEPEWGEGPEAEEGMRRMMALAGGPSS